MGDKLRLNFGAKFYTGAVFSSFMTNYSKLYLTVASTLKHFVNSKKDFKWVNLLVSQNAGFKLFSAWSVHGTTFQCVLCSRYKKQVKNPRL